MRGLIAIKTLLRILDEVWLSGFSLKFTGHNTKKRAAEVFQILDF